MTTDLCLVNPPHPDLVNPHAQAPLGLLYLAAVAERGGWRVTILNLAGALQKSYLWQFPVARVYGITGTYLDAEAVNVVAREIRRQQSASTTIVGGAVALSPELLDYRAINTVVLGEAENVILDLVEKPGPRFLRGEPADVNALPIPARHLWPGPFGGNVFIDGHNYYGGGSATFLTSRGCPYSCAFCAGPALGPRRVRTRDAGAVVAELEEIVTDFGVRQFRLSDEFFSAKRSHAFAVCAAIRQSRILDHGNGIAWRASVGVNPHDMETWKTLHSAGCREVSLGIESADPAVLEKITRKGDIADAQQALRNARAAGLRTRALMMIGLPGTTIKTMQRNLEFFRTAEFDSLAITVFTPVPGCAIAKDPEAFGCRILPKHARRSLCVYGPNGENEIWPTIEIDGMSQQELANQMKVSLAAAEATGKLGKGLP